MLPEKLSTDLTSLGEGEDRLALVVEMEVAADGSIQQSAIYRALVKNHAKLAYRSVAAWLDGKDPMPEKIAKTKGMDDQLRMQDQIAHVMKSRALPARCARPRNDRAGSHVAGRARRGLALERKNRAQGIDRRLHDRGQRGVGPVSRAARDRPCCGAWCALPKSGTRFARWRRSSPRSFPRRPIRRPLSAFLARRRAADPLRFPDLSLTIVKLLGRGEYVVQLPGARSRRAISAWPSRTTAIPRPPIAVFPT